MLSWSVNDWTDAQALTCLEAVNIKVVYNCLLSPDHDWEPLAKQQLEKLVVTGSAECASIDVVTSIPSNHNDITYDQLESLLVQARKLVASVLLMSVITRHGPFTKTPVVSQVPENSLEYPGLHLLWSLAQVTHRLKALCISFIADALTSLRVLHNVQSVKAQDTIFLYFHRGVGLNKHLDRWHFPTRP